MKTIVLLLLAVIHQISGAYTPRYQVNTNTPPPIESIVTLAPNFATAVQQAQSEGKPIMLIILSKNCGSCNKLKKNLSLNKERVQNAAKDLIIVQSTDGTDPAIEVYGSENPYWPRFYFLGPNKNILNIKSKWQQWPNYYETADELIQAMSSTIELFSY